MSAKPLIVKRSLRDWSIPHNLYLERLDEERNDFYFAFKCLHPPNFYYLCNNTGETRMFVFAAGHVNNQKQDLVYLFTVETQLEVLSIISNKDFRNNYKQQCLQIITNTRQEDNL